MKLKANRPHPQDYLHKSLITDTQTTCQVVHMDRQTDGETDATTFIFSLNMVDNEQVKNGKAHLDIEWNSFILNCIKCLDKLSDLLDIISPGLLEFPAFDGS